MAAATLLPRHVFGLKGDVRDNFAYLDEQTVIYPAGHNTIIHNLELRSQKFLPGTDKTEEITAMAVSPNRKFVAVAEKSDKAGITVFDLHIMKRRRPLIIPDSPTKEYISLSFSADSKYLMAQGGGLEWTLVVWTWEKNKLTAQVKTTNSTNSPLYQCSFAPTDSTQVCVTGNTILKQFRFSPSDAALKLLPNALGKREPQNYLCHAWVNDERLLVGTETGEVLLIEGGELKHVLTPKAQEITAIESICVYSKGFVTGSEEGALTLFEKSEDKEYYKRGKTFRIENNAVRVRTLALSQTEEQLVCTLENNQMFLFTLSNADIMKTEDNNFEVLTCSFHSGAITGIDTCIRKPLIATSGLDKSVRIWNYLDKTTELNKYFNEEAHSIAFHPSGHHLLAGFTDKLRLMNVLMDDIRPYKEFAIKACRECRFSEGGHLFAAVNGNTINIFSTYTCELIGNLRGHNGKVRSVAWCGDDGKLVSAGMDGAVYEWRLKDFKREHENVLKSCNYTCAVADMRSVYAVGSDKKIKEISESQINREFEQPVVLNQVVLSHSCRMLFAGSDVGTIVSFKFPLQGPGDQVEYQCHSRPTTRLRVSYDDQYLFSVGEDGCLFILDIRDREVRAPKKEKEMLPFAEEILVTKSDLEEKTALMQELKQKVDELTLQNEYQLRLKDMNHNDEIKLLTERATAELDAEKAKYEMLQQDNNDMEMEYEEKLKQVDERNQTQIATLEATHQQKIMAEVERYQQLLEEKEMLNDRWDEQNAQLIDGHERLIQELTDDYEYKLQDERMQVEKLKEEKEELIKEIEETRRQVEDDADLEIEELKKKYEEKLTQSAENNLSLKGQNGIMKKKFNQLQKEIAQRAEEIKQMYTKQKELYGQIFLLDKEIVGLKKEIKERDETIGDKEKRIYDLKKKNQELEKFKFVLDYKIKELKKQIEPREEDIQRMKDQIKEMDAELERYHKQNSQLDLNISDLKLKLNGLNKELNHQRQKFSDSDVLIKRYRNDLHATIQHIQDPKALKESVKRLYQLHVTEQILASELDADIMKEYNRQREYLEKTNDSLKKKLSKDVELHRQDNMRIMHENVSLIKEINELRREIKLLKQAQRTKEQSTSKSFGLSPQEAAREIDIQKDEIRRLRERLKDLEGAYVAANRPKSREKLPPMDGFDEDVGGGQRLGSAPTNEGALEGVENVVAPPGDE